MNHSGTNHVNVPPEEVFDELSPFMYQGTPTDKMGWYRLD
jgi:hypothetical protein